MRIIMRNETEKRLCFFLNLMNEKKISKKITLKTIEIQSLCQNIYTGATIL